MTRNTCMAISRALAPVAILHVVLSFWITIKVRHQHLSEQQVLLSWRTMYPSRPALDRKFLYATSSNAKVICHYGLHIPKRLYFIYAGCSSHVHILERQTIGLLQIPADNRVRGDTLCRTKQPKRSWVHPSDRQHLTVTLVEPQHTLPFINGCGSPAGESQQLIEYLMLVVDTLF